MPWPEGTNPLLEIETSSHNEPDSVARFVTWIPWDSGFRGSGLKVGDLIVGRGDVRYTVEAVDQSSRIGDASFSRWFDQQKFKPDDPFSIAVLRDDGETNVTGKLGGYRTYRNAEGKRILGEGGPLEYEKDGFDYDWGAWYRQFVDIAKTILAGWDYFVGTNTNQLAERMQPFAARVEFFETKYPGALAKTLREDFDAMKVMVAGEPRQLSEADLTYRTLGDIRAARATEAADAAFKAFLKEVESSLMKNPPSSPNSFTEDTRSLIGQTVRLPGWAASRCFSRRGVPGTGQVRAMAAGSWTDTPRASSPCTRRPTSTRRKWILHSATTEPRSWVSCNPSRRSCPTAIATSRSLGFGSNLWQRSSRTLRRPIGVCSSISVAARRTNRLPVPLHSLPESDGQRLPTPRRRAMC